MNKNELRERYHAVRSHSEEICKPLKVEDYVPQPIKDVSPPKWHLGHVTWFFEGLILKKYLPGYKAFNKDFDFIYNSYYESAGPRILRVTRGNLSRPTVEETYAYRKYVDDAMDRFFDGEVLDEAAAIIEVGLNHEQQHQELLFTDIKYILGSNPLLPVYNADFKEEAEKIEPGYTSLEKGVYQIGYDGNGFCYDNELKTHNVYIQDGAISNRLVTNREYLEFMSTGGYKNFEYWHRDGWKWVNDEGINAPLYWHLIDGKWYEFTMAGLKLVDLDIPVKHISYFEAYAYAQWKGARLPTEFEWEVAADKLHWGTRWEWTESSYLPYPGFEKLPGALSEYNGKFMVSQKVLRGASIATPANHSRKTYRNYFYPSERWQVTGIRLAKKN